MVKPIISGPYRTFRRLNQEESFLEFEGSTITIPMKARATPSGPWMSQEIKLKAFMRLEIYPPYYNNLGTREFQFTIRDWDLHGTSEMLNILFFEDPRGRLVTLDNGLADYVPATVTFNVANHYRVRLDPLLKAHAADLFGDERDIDIRNFTSHSLRTWNEIAARGTDSWFYGHPHQLLYWEILLPEDLKGIQKDIDYLYDAATKRGENKLSKDASLMIFHKKQPDIHGAFNLSSAEDRVRYLVAVTTFDPLIEPGTARALPGTFRATLPVRGFESSLTQLRGNTVLSSLYRPREPLEIRWRLNDEFRDASGVTNYVSDVLRRTGSKRFNGYLELSSPARSLGTADQAPDIGYPFDSADFPARITYAINYNIGINHQRVVEDNAGIAIAVGTVEVPPRDVTVAFDKPHVGHVIEKYLEFGPGHCTGMHEITSAEYRAGVNFARYWRTVPLKHDDPRWDPPHFKPYDPNVEY
ncbi:hypothetical protein [Methylocystis sp.]|uniref:hypothetical protein n=1 Tax=Methylocystis sp. TaxID=1911079 RepID=UPI003DA6C1CC